MTAQLVPHTLYVQEVVGSNTGVNIPDKCCCVTKKDSE